VETGFGQTRCSGGVFADAITCRVNRAFRARARAAFNDDQALRAILGTSGC
jgi:hypothetical protein